MKILFPAIEMWRQKLNLERIVLLGHSLGSFVSSAYALRHPSRIRHLILEDPWGYLEYDENSAERRSKYPLWTKGVLGLLGHVNVMSTFRAAGPYGKSLSRSLEAFEVIRHRLSTALIHSTLIHRPQYVEEATRPPTSVHARLLP